MFRAKNWLALFVLLALVPFAALAAGTTLGFLAAPHCGRGKPSKVKIPEQVMEAVRSAQSPGLGTGLLGFVGRLAMRSALGYATGRLTALAASHGSSSASEAATAAAADRGDHD